MRCTHTPTSGSRWEARLQAGLPDFAAFLTNLRHDRDAVLAR
jgi:hypothetical protein